MRAYVSGRVQGVGFRYATQREAYRLGIAGWARNLPDGRVEVVAQGEPGRIDLFLGFLAEGPRYAAITGLDVADTAVDDGLAGFGVG